MNELPNPTFPFSRLTLREAIWPVSAQPAARTPRLPESSGSKAVSQGISVQWARHQDEVREAQRLRYQVFAGEMGARLSTSLAGHDIDLFDDSSSRQPYLPFFRLRRLQPKHPSPST